MKSRARQNFGAGLQRYNSPADWARKLFKPFADSVRLLVEIEKNFFVLGLGFSGRYVTNVFFCFLACLRGAGRQYNGPIFSLKFFFETRLSSESSEPLIGFLTYLEPKLWHKNQEVVKISTPTNSTLGWITPSLYMAITRRQNRLESCSSPLKTREDVRFRLKKKFFSLRSRAFCWCLHNERMFMHIFLHLHDVIIPWEPTNRADFVTQNFLDSRLQDESLEGLMDFQAFLASNPTNPLGDLYKISGLLAITLAPERPGSRSRPQNINITA